MIGTLLRQDPALRNLPKGLFVIAGVAALNILLLAGLTLTLTGDSGYHAGFLFLSRGISWCALAGYLLLPGCRTRSDSLAMALPLEPRRLWFIHMLAVTLAGFFIIAVLVGVIALQGLLVRDFTSQTAVTGTDLIMVAAHLGVGFILAALLLHTIRPELNKIPAGRRTTPTMVLMLLAVLALVLLLAVLPTLVLALVIGLTGLIGFLVYRTAPESFILVPIHPDEGDGLKDRGGPIREQGRAAIGEKSAVFRYVTIARVLSKNFWLPLVSFPFLFLLGMLFTGFFNDLFGDSDMQYTNITLGAYIMMAFLATPMGFLHHLDGLPISRKSLFAYLVLVPFVVLLIGYGAGSLGMELKRPVARVEYQQEESLLFPSYKAEDKLLRVPVQFCEIDWDGEPRLEPSPWGESHPPWKAPLYRGSRVVLYSPYSAPVESSPEFVAFQLSRAVEAVYGTSIPHREILDRYLETGEDGTVGFKSSGFNLMEDYPDLKEKPGAPLFPFIALMVGLQWLLLAFLYMCTFRATWSDKSRKFVLMLLLVGAMGFHIGLFLLVVFDITEISLVMGFFSILLTQPSASLPGGTALVWLGCGLIFYGAYSFVQARFERIEVPVTGNKTCWL